MTIQKLSKINVLIQRIVFDAGCCLSGKGNLTTYDVIDICRQIVEESDSE